MSQFDALFKNPETQKRATRNTTSRPKRKQSVQLPAEAVAVIEKRRAGKSSDDRYTQVLTYLKKTTHNEVKAALIFDEKKRDLSDLVEELLATWVKENRSS
jgi:hypothetical protein